MKLKDFLTKNLSLDLRSLALMRIILGTVLLTDLIGRSLQIQHFYTDFGVLPRSKLFESASSLSLHALNGSYGFELVLFLTAILFAVFLIVGFKTRTATIASWLLFVSLFNRNPVVIYGFDYCMTIGLMWGIFLPLGERFSIDSYLHKDKRTNNTVFNLATFGFLFHIVLLYFMNGITKSAPEWANGNALFYVLQDRYAVTPLGTYLLHFPAVLTIATHGSLLLERAVPYLLVISPQVRLITLISLFFLHLGIAATMSLYLFSFTTLALLVGLLPSEAWVFFNKKTTKKTGSKEFSLTVVTKSIVAFIIVTVFLSTTQSIFKIDKQPFTTANQLNKQFHFMLFYGLYSPGVTMNIGTMKLTGIYKNAEKETLIDTSQSPNPNFTNFNFNRRWVTYLGSMTNSLKPDTESKKYPYFMGDVSPFYFDYVCRQHQDKGNPLKILELQLIKTPLSLDLTPPLTQEEYKNSFLCPSK